VTITLVSHGTAFLNQTHKNKLNQFTFDLFSRTTRISQHHKRQTNKAILVKYLRKILCHHA